MNGLNGILLIDKPVGVFCGQVLKGLKRFPGCRRIGHAGTLDPMAGGLLLAGLNAGTRVLPYLTGLEKEYRALAQMGMTTDTDDITGRITGKWEGPFPDAAALESALREFIGDIEQVPPVFSAIRVKGVRAYTLARAGRPAPLSPRKIFVRDIRFRGWDAAEHRLEFSVVCSKGTYIRSLVRDLGRKLGCGGTLCGLKRLGIGSFSVEKALSPALFQDEGSVKNALVPLDRALYFLEAVQVTDEMAGPLKNGRLWALNPETKLSDLGVKKGVMANGRVFALLKPLEEEGRIKLRVLRMIEE